MIISKDYHHGTDFAKIVYRHLVRALDFGPRKGEQDAGSNSYAKDNLDYQPVFDVWVASYTFIWGIK